MDEARILSVMEQIVAQLHELQSRVTATERMFETWLAKIPADRVVVLPEEDQKILDALIKHERDRQSSRFNPAFR